MEDHGCIRCDKPLSLAPHDGQEHDVCYIEYDKRIESEMCERCGQNKRNENNVSCSDCLENNKPCVGYPVISDDGHIKT